MKAELVLRDFGRVLIKVRDGDREYSAVYHVRGDWWYVWNRRGQTLRTFGVVYNRVVAACLPLIERAE